MKIYEYNGLTDEHIVRDATPEEIAQREIDAKRAKKELAKAAEERAITNVLSYVDNPLI